MTGPFVLCAPPATAERGWHVRPAAVAEAPIVAAAVRALLRELESAAPAPEAMEDAARILVADPDAGAVFLADADGAIVGMLAASWQVAVHAPGRYALIQDLWVHRDWRGQRVGQELVDALAAVATRRQVTRIEVGVPREGVCDLEATRRFYLRNDFGTIGGRLRRDLAARPRW